MPSEPSPLDDLRIAEAGFRVWRSREASTEKEIAGLVTAAVGLLVSGYDTPNLRILAGEDDADADEVGPILDRTVRELGLEPLDRHESVLVVATQLAREVVADETCAERVAPTIWTLFAHEPMSATWPKEFVRLAYGADAVEDLPDMEGVVPNLIAAARAFLASRA